jgi:hypothetical protein
VRRCVAAEADGLRQTDAPRSGKIGGVGGGGAMLTVACEVGKLVQRARALLLGSVAVLAGEKVDER